MTVMVVEQRHENLLRLVDAPLVDASQCGPQKPNSVSRSPTVSTVSAGVTNGHL
jgi:hypothetical protein